MGELIAGKYRVERVLGVGGMGVVVAVTHLQLGELYALKFLRGAAGADTGNVERFLREARAAVRIKSEHIVRVSDVGQLPNGSPFIAMEYLNGRDLAQVLEQNGPLPTHDAVSYVVQACAGIDANGIVHRDLKPSNLFLTTRSDGSPLIKVLDFGISKVSLDGGSSSLTETHEVFGSPAYMPPEQIRSAKRTDVRSDVWALGVILHELLTGALPFEGETAAALLAAISVDQPRSARASRPDLSEGLDAIIRRCLEKSPEARFASVAELAAALTPFANADSATLAARVVRRASMMPPANTAPAAVASPSSPAAFATTERRLSTQPAGRVRMLGGVAALAATVVGLLVGSAIYMRRGTDGKPTSCSSPTRRRLPRPRSRRRRRRPSRPPPRLRLAPRRRCRRPSPPRPPLSRRRRRPHSRRLRFRPVLLLRARSARLLPDPRRNPLRPPRRKVSPMVRQTRAIRLYASAVVCVAAMFGAVSAQADDVAMAEKLFLEGKRLMDEEKNYERACEKFEAAYELDTTATGTLLNLALCHEQIKRTATAWAEFRQVVARSIGRREDRVALAREHEAKLTPVLSFIIVDVAESARASGLRIEMDKRRPIAEASWGVELPVDPGKHVFEVSAPGKVSRTLEIVVGDTADKQTIAIPILADAPASPVVPPSTGEPGVMTTDSGGTRRTVGYVLGGLGIAALGTGAVFGVLAMNKNGDAEDAAARCPGNLCPNEAARSKAVSAIDDANANANIANVAVGAGIGMLAAGVFLVLTAKPTTSSASAPPTLRIVPQPSGGTISFARAW